MIGCSIEADPNVFQAETNEGLIKGHAYSITKIQLVDIQTPKKKGQIQLVRIRNPWGNEIEWKGAWSDKGPQWQLVPENTKIQLDLTSKSDGEFWMSFKDFLEHFDRLEICHFEPGCLNHEPALEWTVSAFDGEWVKNVSAGGCRNYLESFHHNPQYEVNIEGPTEVSAIMSLMQKYHRSRKNRGEGCLNIGFIVYRLSEEDLKQKPLGKSFFESNMSAYRVTFINKRDVTLRVTLEPGQYLIVPSTFEPNKEGGFLMRVFSETCCSLR